MSDFIEQIREKRRENGVLVKKSIDWYLEEIKQLGFIGTTKKEKFILEGKTVGREMDRERWGSLYIFKYSPKYKDTLPYYDIFPLVLPLEFYEDGFLGINFHYLPIPLRIMFLERLARYATGPIDVENKKSKFLVNYNKINTGRTGKILRPCVKKYLQEKFRSPFRKIDSVDWTTAILLPVQRFRKARESRVWYDSRRAIFK